MNISLNKLKAIILYFSLNTNKLGKVKLMKLFYYLDFIHLKKYGRPVTFDIYKHLDHGRIPSTILNIINEAVDDINSSVLKDTIKIEKIETKREIMTKFSAARNFTENDHDLLSESELDVLSEIVKRFRDSSSDEIEEVSHKENAYKETEYLETIPYTLAAKDKDSKVTEEEIELLMRAV